MTAPTFPAPLTDYVLRSRDEYAANNGGAILTAVRRFMSCLVSYERAAGGMASDGDFAAMTTALAADATAFATSVATLTRA
jgi:hypothetical protein